MRNIFIAALFFATQVFAADTIVNTDKLKVGKKSSAATKIVEFDINGGAANPKIQVNPSTSKLQFTNDGTVFKDIGSGSGGGSGINLLSNGGFETGLSDGWTSSGGGTFALVTSGSNLLYQLNSASFVASAGSQIFETLPVLLPNILYGQDCMAQISYKGGDANIYMTVMDSLSAELIPTTARAVLNTTSGVKKAKIYFSCPSSGSIKIRFASTAASVIASYDEAFLGQSDSKPVSSRTSKIQYTPTLTNFGNASSNMFYQRDGQDIIIDGYFAIGSTAPTGVMTFSLPAGLSMDMNKVAVNLSGVSFLGHAVGYRNSSGATYEGVVYNGVGTATAFQINNVAGGTNWSATQPITWAQASQDRIYINNLRVPIDGWASNEDSINSKCPNDIACENVFTAQISATGVVTGENLDWINANCSASTGNYTCNFNSGVFTVAPNCTSSTTTSAASAQHVVIPTTSSSSINFLTFAAGAGGNISTSLTCQKQGSDFKAKQNIQGFLTSTVTSAANNLRIIKARIAGASDSTVCSSSPCTVYRSTGEITSATRIGTGQYNVVISAGVFSESPSCSFGVSVAGGSGMAGYNGTTGATATSIAVVTHAPAGTNNDSVFDITCVGLR